MNFNEALDQASIATNAVRDTIAIYIKEGFVSNAIAGASGSTDEGY